MKHLLNINIIVIKFKKYKFHLVDLHTLQMCDIRETFIYTCSKSISAKCSLMYY